MPTCNTPPPTRMGDGRTHLLVREDKVPAVKIRVLVLRIYHHKDGFTILILLLLFLNQSFIYSCVVCMIID